VLTSAAEPAPGPSLPRPFPSLDDAQSRELFHRAPSEVARDARNEQLAASLGATLYTPGTRADLAATIRRVAALGVTSMVACLEDSIPDHAVPAAQRNVVQALRDLSAGGLAGFPQLYIRVRNPGQLSEIAHRAGGALDALSGFVAPKFSASNGAEYLEAAREASLRSGIRLLVMPVLETPDIAYAETRADTLARVSALLDAHRDAVLAVRIGGTDLAGLFGLRRGRDVTCYELGPVREAIAAIVNTFGRTDGTGFPITGCVWEYYTPSEPVLRPQLRLTPFERSHATSVRSELIGHDLDGLVREVVLDKANGLTGKTVIHPSHVPVVHALLAVTHEEWEDAVSVNTGGGAHASTYRNKMNESNPHAAWARAVLTRAAAFGVLAENVTFADLLSATV
jgi:citrate lyase beta subunit